MWEFFITPFSRLSLKHPPPSAADDPPPSTAVALVELRPEATGCGTENPIFNSKPDPLFSAAGDDSSDCEPAQGGIAEDSGGGGTVVIVLRILCRHVWDVDLRVLGNMGPKKARS